tara:strand:- start:583 stop:3429 length:2847 start_codon:yes stop_codon:yes gene_type:complete
MSSDIKINGINVFLNRFDTSEEIVDIDKLKTDFPLDDDEEGFYRLSLSQKKFLGNETINDNYTRPPIGPIEKGLYCSVCDAIGPEDHREDCDNPQKESLFLTIKGIKDYVLVPSYNGDFLNIKNKINENTITQEELNDEVLLLEDQISPSEILNDENEDILTKISFDSGGVFKKRGPKKLAAKTSTTQFLNNVIISHERSENKTSIRISKNGLINLINVPEDENDYNVMITELIDRIRDSDVINKTALEEITGEQEYRLFPDYSYIHSMSAQFTLSDFDGKQVDFENLDNLISPYDSSGKLISSAITNVETTASGKNVIIYNDIRIIEWEYSLGRMTRTGVMSKEYIKFVNTPAPGLKMTCIINKYGTITMTISKCSDKTILQGLCQSGETVIKTELFRNVVNVFDELFRNQMEILTSKAIDKISKEIKSYNTVSGNAVPSSVCRNTQTRIDDDGNTWKEGKRPDPYSWSGTCPDPNYQYLSPEGVQGPDGLWYPCCKAKSEKSVQMMRDYLIKGFPRNQSDAEKYNIVDGEDIGSGILIPDSNSPGSTAEVNINGRIETVTVIKKKSKKSNDYTVRTRDGEFVTIEGEAFKKDSRVFPGLDTFNKNQLIECVKLNLKRLDFVINQEGNIIKNKISELSEKILQENTDIFSRLIPDTSIITKRNLTTFSINSLKTVPYVVKNVPGSGYPFFLCLGPGGNFYINLDLMSIDSEISDRFDTDIILFGYLKKNETENVNEFHVVDLIYYDESYVSVPFTRRNQTIMELQNSILNTITDEIIAFPDFFNDIIDGSYYFMNENKSNSLVFINSEICDYITWGEKDTTDDIIELQVLELTKGSIIKFGHSERTFPEGLSFLTKYEFTKREIPDKLLRGDYVNVKINRDFSGNIVPKRKISILNKTDKTYEYDKILNDLYNKFKPTDISLFIDPDEWYISRDERLIYNGTVLSNA